MENTAGWLTASIPAWQYLKSADLYWQRAGWICVHIHGHQQEIYRPAFAKTLFEIGMDVRMEITVEHRRHAHLQRW